MSHPSGKGKPCRPFGLFDALILVAGWHALGTP